jgi:hypothetical protein
MILQKQKISEIPIGESRPENEFGERNSTKIES